MYECMYANMCTYTEIYRVSRNWFESRRGMIDDWQNEASTNNLAKEKVV